MNKKTMKYLLLVGLVIVVIILGVIIFTNKKDGIEGENFSIDGNTLNIKMSGLGTSGYDWYYTLSNPILNVSVTTVDNNCSPEMAGCSDDYIYKLTPLKSGDVTVTFVSKFFEEDENHQPGDKYVYQIDIDKNLNIKVKDFQIFDSYGEKIN